MGGFPAKIDQSLVFPLCSLYAEEIIQSFQFSLVNKILAFECQEGRLFVRNKEPEKSNKLDSLRFIFRNSGHPEFI